MKTLEHPDKQMVNWGNKLILNHYITSYKKKPKKTTEGPIERSNNRDCMESSRKPERL